MLEFGVQKKSKCLISLTPLIDVVFILLIFFMLATSFAKWRSIDLNFGEPTNTVNLEKKAILVELKQDDELTVNGVPRSVEELEILLEEKLQKDSNYGVLLQPDDEVALQAVVNIMQRLRSIAGDNISLAKAPTE